MLPIVKSILLLSKVLLSTKVGQNRACLKARSTVARFGKRSRSKRSAKAVNQFCTLLKVQNYVVIE